MLQESIERAFVSKHAPRGTPPPRNRDLRIFASLPLEKKGFLLTMWHERGPKVLVALVELATAVSASLPESPGTPGAFLIDTNRYMHNILSAEEKQRTTGA